MGESSKLIDDRVSLSQANKAVTALLDHVRRENQQLEEKELLPAKEQHVWMVVAVKRMQPLKKLKPRKIPLSHPLVDPRTSTVCLITKDPQREYKDLLESHGIRFISRVVGLQKLRGKFKGFDARRLLLKENDLFLADERVIPLLPGLLGKKWFDAKKQPIPVSLTKKTVKAELENAISSTYMHQNQGTCTSVKIARISQTDKHVLENLVTALPAVIARIHGGWDNVQSINIKTSSSVSLPIWSCPLGHEEAGSRWQGMIVDEEWDGFGAGSEDHDSMDAVSGEGGTKLMPPQPETHKTSKSKSPRTSAAVATHINDERSKKELNQAHDAKQSPATLSQKPSRTPAEKKISLGSAHLAKKGKLRETERSTKKSGKVGLVGR